MKVEIQLVSYKQPHPYCYEAINKMMAHSACKCFQDGMELVRDCAVVMRGEKKAQQQNMLKKLREGDLAGVLHPPRECPKGKHEVYIAPRGSSSVVHWSRNDLMSKRQQDADYFLLCDDDMVPPPDALDRMLLHRKHIVSGLCTKRQDPPEPTMRTFDEYLQNYSALVQWEDKRLLEVDAVGTGFLLLSQQVVEHVALHYNKEFYEKTGNGFWFEFLRTVRGGEWGEDISFCWKAQRLGYRVYVDTTVCPGHVGDYSYNVDDYLAHQGDVMAAGSFDAYRRQLPEASAAIYGRKPQSRTVTEAPSERKKAEEEPEMDLGITFQDGEVLAEARP